MVFPSFSTKQRRARAVWVAAGLAAILVGLPPYTSVVIGIAEYPDPRQILCFFGIVGAVSGVGAFFTRMKPLFLFGLTLFAIVTGLLLANFAFNAAHPELSGPFTKGAEEQAAEAARRSRPYSNFGFVVGAAAVPLFAAVSAALRKRSDLGTQAR